MTISMVVAMGEDGTIGHHGELPWHIPADLAHFKRVTSGFPVIMGRKTFESIGRVLPGRHNIVVTTDSDWQVDGVTVCAGLPEAVREAARGSAQAFIIGGAQIYAQALDKDLVDELIVSRVHAAPGGDTRFPVVHWRDWHETSRTAFCDSDPPFDVVTYARRARAGAR